MSDKGQARMVILKRDASGKETVIEEGPWVNVERDFTRTPLTRPRELAPDEILASEWRPTPEAA